MKNKLASYLGIALLISSCGSGETPSTAEITKGNKLVVDVRSEGEWDAGHKECTVHFPLDKIQNHEKELMEYDTVYFVCQSGVRAGQASSYMQSKNPDAVYINAGSWVDLPCE